MPILGVIAEFEAAPGKELAVAEFLTQAQALVEAEPGTRTWYAFRRGERSFGIFDTFDTEEDRQAHLTGEVPKAIQARADELFAVPPTIAPVDVLATKPS